MWIRCNSCWDRSIEWMNAVNWMREGNAMCKWMVSTGMVDVC